MIFSNICWKHDTPLQSLGIHYSSAFYSTLLTVFVLKILDLTERHFSPDILVPFPDSNNLYSRALFFILILRSTTKFLQFVGGISQKEIFWKERSTFNMLYMGYPTPRISLGKLVVSQSVSCEFRLTKAYIF